MKRRVQLALGAAGVFVGAFVAGSVAGAVRPRSNDATTIIQRAKASAARDPFTGVIEVTWLDDQGTHTTRAVMSSGANGMQSGSVSVGSNGYRDTSTGVWFAPVVGEPAASPDPSDKYQLMAQRWTPVAGRSTTAVEASVDGSVRERWVVDDQTGMLLQRDVFDSNGMLSRRLQVVELAFAPGLLPTTTTTTTTRPGTERRVNATALSSIQAPYVAPTALSRGYQIVGRYQLDDGTVQALYSDGLRDVSVFQQRGALDASSLPNGGATRNVRGINVWQYVAAGETMWVWERNGMVMTLIADAPSSELTPIVEQFRPKQPNWWDRFRGWIKGWFS